MTNTLGEKWIRYICLGDLDNTLANKVGRQGTAADNRDDI